MAHRRPHQMSREGKNPGSESVDRYLLPRRGDDHSKAGGVNALKAPGKKRKLG